MSESGKLARRLLAQRGGVRIHIAVTIALGLAGGVLTVLQARTLSQVVSGVFLEGAALPGVQPLLLVLLIIALGRGAVTWAGEVTAGRAAGQVKTDMRARLVAHLQALGPAYGWGERSGELVNTLTGGIEALDAYFSQYLPQLALAALVPLSILAFVFPIDLLSAIVLLLTAPLIPLFMILIGNLGDRLARRQWLLLSRLSAHFLDVLQGITTLKLFGRSRAQVEIIARISDRFRDTTLGVLRVTFLSALVLELIATISTAVVAVEVGLRLLYGNLAFEQAFFILILAPEFYQPLRLLGTRFHAGLAGMTAARRIFELLDTPAAGPDSATTGNAIAPDAFNICFDDVHHSYEGGERAALRGASFEIHAGERVALVGPSGAGKSTVAQLLLRFVHPSRGRITCAGRPLIDYPAEAWLERVAWVPQDPYLFCGSVAENIRLGRPDASWDDVVQAARLAQAHEFIQALPQGYDTVIGERGARLSGGQTQRIALARAFLKDAPFLILDEATANLDSESEALVQAAMGRLLQGRTALIITHRLQTAQTADRVIVLAEGRVAEAGAPGDLARQGGVYAGLIEASAPPRAAADRPAPMSTAGAAELEAAKTGPVSAPSPVPLIYEHSPSSLPAATVLRRLIGLLRPFRRWVALSVGLGFAAVASSVGLMATAAWIIASAALQPSIADLHVAIVGVRFFGLARAGFRYLERLASHQVTFRLLAHLRVWFYRGLEPLAPARLQQYRSADLLSRVVADVDVLEHFYVRAVAPPLVALLAGAAIAAFIGHFVPSAAWALLACLTAAGMGLPLLVHGLSRGPGRRLAIVRGNLYHALLDGVQGMGDILACGQAASHRARVRDLSRELVRIQQRMGQVHGLQAGLGTLLVGLGALSVLALAIPLVSSGQMTGVMLPVMVLAAVASFEAVLPLPLAAEYVESSLAAARRLYAVIDGPAALPELPADATEPRPAGTEPASTLAPAVARGPRSDAPALAVENLRFRYTTAGPWVLDGIRFRLPKEGCLAVVGPSGSGKSTLANVLLRFWDYESGKIWLDGRDLRSYSEEDARCRIGVVAQQTHLFNATLRDNLLLARPGADQTEIERATRAAEIHEFIRALPDGYDTWIGERGVRLSGGERQRLALARALLKDAPILILDEATANLDPVTERAVLQTLRGLMARRAVLMITHRLMGLEMADEVLVLDHGRVVARGAQHELLGTPGIYRRMWEWQAQGMALDLLNSEPGFRHDLTLGQYHVLPDLGQNVP